ncbi:LuxR C-terminal-related transcriptional regulator [Spirochaetota bacterium]
MGKAGIILNKLLRAFIFGKDRIEYPDTFREELNYQSSRIILMASLISSFVWIPYIPIDIELYPGEPLIIFLRAGLSITGIIIFILQFFKKFRKFSLIFLTFISLYLEISTGILTGLTKGDTVYVGGYLFVLTMLAVVPLPRITAWVILLLSVTVFFAVCTAKGITFTSVMSRYSQLDLIVVISVGIVFIYILDRTRFRSWAKSKEIEIQRKLGEDILSNINDSVFLVAPDLKIISANKMAESLLAIDLKEGTKHISISDIIQENDDTDRTLQLFQKKVGDSIPEKRLKINLHSLDGKQLLVNARISQVWDKFGDYRGMLVIAKEVRGMKKLTDLYGLTEREVEVVRHVMTGCTSKQISESLDITERTVKAHLTNIFNKIGIDNRIQLFNVVVE